MLLKIQDDMENSKFSDLLFLEIPELSSFPGSEKTGLPYPDFGNLGLFLGELIKLKYNLPNCLPQKCNYGSLIPKIFSFLGRLFKDRDFFSELDIENLLYVEIYELLITTQFGYFESRINMTPEMYDHFLAEYPIEKFKENWNTEGYYSNEEIDEILKK